MLGLNVNTLAVPDYEIISRMEKLIECQHEMALAYRPKDEQTSDPGKKGYMMEAQRRMKIRSNSKEPLTNRWK